jgi:hypothetical protein
MNACTVALVFLCLLGDSFWSLRDEYPWHRPGLKAGDCEWKVRAEKGAKHLNRVEESENGQVVTLVTERAYVGVVKLLSMEEGGGKRFSRIGWEWRVDRFPEGRREDRDQAIQVYLISSKTTDNQNRSAIGFVWTKRPLPTDPQRRKRLVEFDNVPILGVMTIDVRILEQRSENSTEAWKREEVEPGKVFGQLFGPTFKDAPICAIVVFADSNHTKSKTIGMVRGVRLVEQDADSP